jgi:hypothetical protein
MLNLRSIFLSSAVTTARDLVLRAARDERIVVGRTVRTRDLKPERGTTAVLL